MASNELSIEARSVNREMSDHNVVMAGIKGKDGSWTPRNAANKEMFFSNLLNEIKKEHLPAYLRYVW